MSPPKSPHTGGTRTASPCPRAGRRAANLFYNAFFLASISTLTNASSHHESSRPCSTLPPASRTISHGQPRAARGARRLHCRDTLTPQRDTSLPTEAKTTEGSNMNCRGATCKPEASRSPSSGRTPATVPLCRAAPAHTYIARPHMLTALAVGRWVSVEVRVPRPSFRYEISLLSRVGRGGRPPGRHRRP